MATVFCCLNNSFFITSLPSHPVTFAFKQHSNNF